MYYPTSWRKKMLIALTKPPDSHNADHSQTTTVCRRPPFFVGDALALKNYAIRVPCGKGEARRVQPDYKQLYLYQSPEQAFALGLLSPWEGARGHRRKTRKAYFAFVVFHGRGSEWYTKYHPSPMQQQQPPKNNMGKYLMV